MGDQDIQMENSSQDESLKEAQIILTFQKEMELPCINPTYRRFCYKKISRSIMFIQIPQAKQYKIIKGAYQLKCWDNSTSNIKTKSLNSSIYSEHSPVRSANHSMFNNFQKNFSSNGDYRHR